MAISKSGDNFVFETSIFAGFLGDGTVTFNGGSSAFEEVQAGRNGDRSGDTVATGIINLRNGAQVLIADQSNNEVFYGELTLGSASFSPRFGTDGRLSVTQASSLIIRNSVVVKNSTGQYIGGYANLIIAEGFGTNGLATVSGAGSRLLATGGAPRISVGSCIDVDSSGLFATGGVGELRVAGGGLVGTLSLEIGKAGADDEPSSGTVSIDGAGSRVVLSSSYGSYGPARAGQSGGFAIGLGDSGSGALVITNGGVAVAQNVDGATDGAFATVARDAGSSGVVRVTGPGSSLQIVQSGAVDAGKSGSMLTIGVGGRGRLTVTQGGTVAVSGDGAATIVAATSGAVGAVTVDGSGSRLQAGALLALATAVDFTAVGTSEFLDTQLGPTASLMLTNGGEVAATRTVIGRNGTLGGDGRLVGSLELTGTLAPEDSDGIATFGVSGDLNVRSGGRLAIDIRQFIDGGTDVIDVGGSVTGAAPILVVNVGADARFEVGQTVTILRAGSILSTQSFDFTADGFDFALRTVGQTWVMEALEARNGFSLERSTSTSNEIVLSDDGGSVRVRLGALIGETATGIDLIDGSRNADRIVAVAGLTRAMTIDGGAGHDVVQTSGGDNTVYGGDGADRLFSRQGDDILLGGAGDDVISAFESNDTLSGGDGADNIVGWRGTDSIDGGAGDDVIRGDFDADRIEGGAGADRLLGGTGRDVCVFRAGFGEDRVLDYNPAQELLDFTLHDGVDGFGDLALSRVGTSVLVTDGAGGRLILADVDLASVTAADFLF